MDRLGADLAGQARELGAQVQVLLPDDASQGQTNRALSYFRSTDRPALVCAITTRLIDRIDHIARHSDTQVIFVSHSAGEAPACINQRLTFEPLASGYALRCEA